MSQPVSARSRMGLAVFVYGLRFLIAALLALPFCAAIASTNLGSFPRGDALLFQPGGLYLIEVTRLAGSELKSLMQSSIPSFVIAEVIVIGCEAFTLVGLLQPGKFAVGAALERSLSRFPTLILLAAGALLAEIVLLVAAIWLGFLISDHISAAHFERARDLVFLGFAVLGALLCSVLGVIATLARAAAVAFESSARRALGAGLDAFRSRRGESFLGWLLPTLATLGLIVAGVLISDRLRLESGSKASLLTIFVVHQTAAFGLVWFRQVWLAKALRLVQTQADVLASR